MPGEVLTFQCSYNFYFPFLTVSMKLVGDHRKNLGITLKDISVLGDDSFTILIYDDFFILYSCDTYGYRGVRDTPMIGSFKSSKRLLKKRLMDLYLLNEPCARCLVAGIYRMKVLNNLTFRERGIADDGVCF